MAYPKNNEYKYSLNKLLCSTDDHLDRECQRRGISRHYMKTKVDKVLAIIRHDAYYEGVNDQKNRAVVNSWLFSQSNPVEYVREEKPQKKQKPQTKKQTEKERRDYLLRDWQENETTYLKLTDDQARLMTWLMDRGFLSEVDFDEADEIEFEEI